MRTANVTTITTKFHQIQVRVPNGIQIKTTSYTLPNNTQDLLCLAYVVDDIGAVMFTATGRIPVIKKMIGQSNKIATQHRRTYKIRATYKTNPGKKVYEYTVHVQLVQKMQKAHKITD